MTILDVAFCLALADKNSSKTSIQQKREQLRLALEWNRVDIAEKHIMKHERNWEVSDGDAL